ncbi:hypothetical protein SASPL_137322 [Salvia splendens]|uniref:Uncharacterized protein n=1 Tax=Salvia splendens TaxID=180675 RepID=A0A8X8WRH9_SALSN|nr:hypothetical protein SASPL_137322 [Salvia splendens]
MNYFTPNQQQHDYHTSSQNQQSYDQFTNNPYSYPYPNPQFATTIPPYSYQNPPVQPSQHHEQEPHPPGVTPPPPPQVLQNSYYQYNPNGGGAAVPTAASQLGAMDAGVPALVHQPCSAKLIMLRNRLFCITLTSLGISEVGWLCEKLLVHDSYNGLSRIAFVKLDKLIVVPELKVLLLKLMANQITHKLDYVAATRILFLICKHKIAQPLYGSVGYMDGMVPRGDPQTQPDPKLNVSSYVFGVDGYAGGHSLPMNATTPYQDHSATAYGGIHLQGGPFQLLPQPSGEPHYGHRANVSGRTNHGRGRGKGSVQRKHAGAASLPSASSVAQTQPLQGSAQLVSVSPSPKVVSCELCKIECNTLEVLQQHLIGKKHKKKLKVFEELQSLNKKVTSGQADQVPAIQSNSEAEAVSMPNLVEGSGKQQPQQEVLPSQESNEESKAAGEKRKVEEVEHPEESAKKVKVDGSERVGRGVKHKLRGGKSNRMMRPSARLKNLVQPPKPKEVTPLVCELCNAKCESLVVFQSHLAGKKHKSKAKRFMSQVEQELPQAQGPATMQGFSAYQVASAQPESLVAVSGALFPATIAAEGTGNMGCPVTGSSVLYPGAEMVGGAAGFEQSVSCGTTLYGGSSSEQNSLLVTQPPPH